jgi:predicted nucleic acid-binding protein
MSDPEKALVDTNVILDVAEADTKWHDWSFRQMNQFPSRLIIKPLIYTELCYRAAAIEEVEATTSFLGLLYHELPREALFLAARAFGEYRKRGSPRSAPLADFFIGAHAEVIGVPILTRDVNRYRTYFPRVRLICP